MNEKEYILSQKDCAEMLGMSMSKYNEEIKNIKRSKFSKKTSKKINKTILNKLGISKKDLKKKENIEKMNR